MAKKHVSEDQSSTSRADELISSYLGDMFAVPASDAPEEVIHREQPTESRAETDVQAMDPAVLKEQLRDALISSTIDSGRGLVSTIDLMEVAKSKAMLTKSESFLMLLISLYYLRRPLPDRVKQSFIDVSERMLDDYEAADWQAQISRPNGVLSEARS